MRLAAECRGLVEDIGLLTAGHHWHGVCDGGRMVRASRMDESYATGAEENEEDDPHGNEDDDLPAPSFEHVLVLWRGVGQTGLGTHDTDLALVHVKHTASPTYAQDSKSNATVSIKPI
jgi:hypothetical protein